MNVVSDWSVCLLISGFFLYSSKCLSLIWRSFSDCYLATLTSPFRRHYDHQADPSYLLPGCYSNSGGCSLSTQQCSPSSQQERVQILISCTSCEGTRNGKDATARTYCQNILYIGKWSQLLNHFLAAGISTSSFIKIMATSLRLLVRWHQTTTLGTTFMIRQSI